MTKISILCLLVAFAYMVSISDASPIVADGNHDLNVLDELILRLQQLRQLSEGKETVQVL